MKITEVKLLVLEEPAGQPRQVREIARVPGLRRIQYTHTSTPVEGARDPLRQNFIEVHTDEGIVGRCTTTMGADGVGILRHHAVGRSPLEREALFQMFHKGTRWVSQRGGWFGDFDNCLWDILGKAAGLPIYAMVGRVRDRFPVYVTGGNLEIEGYLEHIEAGKTFGAQAYKFHSYKGGKRDIAIYREVRQEVGPDYVLITDPVCSYDLREAIEVGHVLEELDFIWLEEPMHEQKINLYQELCDELSVDVMGTETIMYDMGLTTQWLIQGATDRLRANARNGTTQVLKMAHFAELHGANIEMNAQGGLFGHIHANLGCCIDNTDYYEYFGYDGEGNRKEGEQWGMLNGPLIEDGHIVPTDHPGWGAEWDEEKFHSMVVEEY